MSIAARNAILADGAALPYDKRVEYIESTNAAAYFHLFDALPNISTTPNSYDSSWEDMWEAVICAPNVGNYDRKLFGMTYTFGMSAYNGKWRPSFLGDWPTNLNIPIATYNPIMFRGETGKIQVLTSDGKTTIWSKTGTVFVRIPDKTWGLARLAVGAMFGNNGVYATVGGTNRIYSFRRVLQNQPEFTLVPCVKDGVAGMYDEVSGTFCASTSGTPFVAGPDASAANGGRGGGISANA